MDASQGSILAHSDNATLAAYVTFGILSIWCLRMRFDWQTVSVALRSPAVRITALLPVLGYLVIFSSEMSGWLNTSILGESFLLEPSTKIRMLYYGGISYFVALLIYSAWCPPVIKEFENAGAAADGVWDSVGPNKVFLANEWLLLFLSSDTFYHSAMTDSQKEQLVKYQTATFNYLARGGFHYNGEQNQLLDTLQKNIDSPKRLDGDFVKSFQRILKTAYEGHSVRSVGFIADTMGMAVIMENYNFAKLRVPWFRIPTAILSRLGLLLIALPASETFIHVLIVDLPRFN